MGEEFIESSNQCAGDQGPILSGDLNQDGSIDVVVLVDLILNNSDPSEAEILISDMNNDGLVNVISVVLLLEIILF